MATASIYELEGDVPTNELEGDVPTNELEGDLPTPSTTFSESSLRPRPLNFSRPRPLHSPLPTSELQGVLRRQDSNESDLAAPPPIVRTYASSVDLEDLHQTDIIRDSIDEAIPPPIRTHSNWTDSSYSPPPLATSASHTATNHAARATPWIYKPYVNSVSSQRDSVGSSSAATDESRDTAASDDTTRTDYVLREEEPDTPFLGIQHKLYQGPPSDALVVSNAPIDKGPSSKSSIASFAFDGRLGWDPRPQLSSAEAERQRWAPQQHPSSGTSGGSAATRSQSQIAATTARREDSAASSEQALLPTTTRVSTASSSGSSTGGAPPPIPARLPRIVKRMSVDQRSEHVNPWQGESMSDRGSVSSNEWASSDHDTSGLSIEKIHKLKKKGINPALYVEMQNARKGKSKWISPLQGNSFLM